MEKRKVIGRDENGELMRELSLREKVGIFGAMITCNLLLGIIVMILLLPRCCPAMITDHQAVMAIIGEAEGEPLQGKIAVAEVIRNRDSLKGIYGVSAPRVIKHQYSAQTFADATTAWEISKTSNLTGGAMGWGNAADIRKFKTQRWFKKCRVVKQIGNHYFWKELQ